MEQPTASAVEEIPIAVAAARLGVSTEALRKRIARGTLAGRKRGVHWYVVLPSDTSGQTDVRPASGQRDAPAGQEQAALIAQLRSENEFLRGLVADLTRRLPGLAEGRSEHPEIVPEPLAEAAETPKRRSWWQRLLGR
jgi:hypothetical protein